MSESLFEKTVKTENSFLAGGFNFKLVSSTERHVRYESNEVYVEYYFENGRGYEIDFWIGKLDSERSYSSDQIQDFFNSNITEVLGKSATTDELVRKIVSHLSTILKKDAPKLLTGDKEIFNELQKFNQQKILEYSIETNLRQARNKAETAWHNKDYKIVVEALEPLSTYLSESEKTKLEYCKKQ